MMSLIFSVLFLFSGNVPAEVPYTSVQTAFKSGNADAIAAICKDKCIISVLGDEGAYSKSQATQILKNFFTKNPASSFAFIHKGSGSNEGAFGIGTYASKGSEFRVTVHFKNIGGAFKIESISIEN